MTINVIICKILIYFIVLKFNFSLKVKKISDIDHRSFPFFIDRLSDYGYVGHIRKVKEPTLVGYTFFLFLFVKVAS